MNDIYIFGHRGASGYCPGNTMSSFKRAVQFKVGIETDVRLTRDNKLICFHDPAIKIDNKWFKVKNLRFKELNLIQFEDGRNIPLLKKVFKTFKNVNYDLKYSFDIGSKKAGKKLIEYADEFNLLSKIQINVTRYYYIEYLRKEKDKVKIVFTVPYKISKLKDSNIDFSKLRKLNIKIINIRRNKHLKDNFKTVIDNGFNSYVWGINSKKSMRDVIKMKYRNQSFKAVYTDYPDILIKIMERMGNK